MVKRLAVVCHCILNMNSRAPGIAIHKGVMEPLFHFLRNRKFKIFQLPCVETSFCGLRRWWQVKEQYDNVNFRRHCRKLAKLSVDYLEKYSVEGFKIYVLGLGISPSCGVRMTQSNPEWGGRPFNVTSEANVAEGRGVWIEELEKELKERKINYKLTDIPPVLLYPEYRVPKGTIYPETK